MQVRFAQTLSQLRHEKGVSQRQACPGAGGLQALRPTMKTAPGARPAFVVRACDYYQVSADYLLGRRVEREGGRAQGAPGGVDPAVLRSAAEVLTQLCLELCPPATQRASAVPLPGGGAGPGDAGGEKAHNEGEETQGRQGLRRSIR